MKQATRLLAVMAALLLSAPISLSASAGAAPTKPVAVEIRNFAFWPKTLTVSAGTRVVWTNRDDEPHVVVSAGHQFASSVALDTSDSYAVTFDHAGTYTYYCAIHPMMVGTIIVQ
ncbi:MULTISPECIES: cupredoxin domain-containing protein [Dyella]|uniref:cupredoxin domain-containing protein n=1 Tax=Dyella TaxID=231454 RepID=UPI000C842F53|nr:MULTISPECIES: cupredoxin domain-containing protein [Dyella]MDR3444540.1 cupredoxin domain-containing protein [Dyella sp.]PMQ05598.1 Plastocyanin [Dyella sp. AD56]ULU24823.1 cupredoxin domain-containing protein [Dyella terrae]